MEHTEEGGNIGLIRSGGLHDYGLHPLATLHTKVKQGSRRTRVRQQGGSSQEGWQRQHGNKKMEQCGKRGVECGGADWWGTKATDEEWTHRCSHCKSTATWEVSLRCLSVSLPLRSLPLYLCPLCLSTFYTFLYLYCTSNLSEHNCTCLDHKDRNR